ncbi:2-succinyl-5-enolpyruvyl-6-hydroxy-3-cyclohexene-1-carboxylic-acid synthase [Dyadobacter flavalbus]|uniref:2-succinyl-5-enolpyruvyl-6-hydroxy-3-cyclohexene-1-carboxylate synthase n=1 Tax=Dyadobacter flavalbus TaxID=2579942 RepID=A0A5M8QWW4_9BACT|nr:2-succinyl-5-enolpyruvyl-6-hydroxy-3-cyclohexene-1-carboxylic-acid synthase [Dyadobacter flavalbus]KAA6439156.1 2-succinyl-5-enolpyruvyl-6-hydroxy-3-cyclohexene-1-carboxylic-acid synthase [Dyadobacter flavalbus]
MAILQPLIDLAAVCYRKGIRHVVISPGSRSAALTLAFTRHKGFSLHVCMDERSAGFIALGMAQQLNIPVVLICTSGSAAYNYAPAVSEAFFQQVPLLVLSADRPKEWLHQYDGQTIYQTEIFGKHVKRSFEFSSDYEHKDVKWAINRISNEAVNLAGAVPMGPVHINVPIREPFYPSESDHFQESESIRIIEKPDSSVIFSEPVWHELLNEWDDSPKILIAGGQNKPDPELKKVLGTISEEWDIPVLGDCITNIPDDEFITSHDLFLNAAGQELVPDLLITFGLSFISKEFKQFIRKNPPRRHWHIGEDEFLTDPMQSLTKQVSVSAGYFFKNLFERIDNQLFIQNSEPETDAGFKQNWLQKEYQTRSKRSKFLRNMLVLNDLTAIDNVFKAITQSFQLHVGNSMSVRYVNALGIPNGITGVFCNRGTSGIDGCVSTAIGAAMVNHQDTLLIVGDVAFLYDRNGLLIAPLPQHLKIIVINNAGGNIFRMIEGPGALPEIETYFETRHSFTAERTCADSGIAYFRATDIPSLHTALHEFLESRTISLLEIFTDPYENEKAWKSLKGLFRA